MGIVEVISGLRLRGAEWILAWRLGYTKGSRETHVIVLRLDCSDVSSVVWGSPEFH